MRLMLLLIAVSLSIVNLGCNSHSGDSVGIVIAKAGSSMACINTKPIREMAAFTVALDSMPNGTVVLDVIASTHQSSVISKSSLTFTPMNYTQGQLVTINGVNDQLVNGVKLYDIKITTNSTATSDTTGYDSLAPVDVSNNYNNIIYDYDNVGVVMQDADIIKLWGDTVGLLARGEGVIPLIDGDQNETYKLMDLSRRAAYHYQDQMMLFSSAAYCFNKADWISDVEKGLGVFKKFIHDLDELRALADTGAIVLDPFFLSKVRTGTTPKKVLVFKTKQDDLSVPEYTWHDIAEKQTVAYISHVISLMNRRALSLDQKELFLYYLDFIINDYLYMIATEIEAWHWSGAYPNIRELLHAKLEVPLASRLQNVAYYSAINDNEWWVFFIAAKIKEILLNNEQLKSRYEPEKIVIIDEVLDIAYQTFKQRLAGDAGFLYDVGKWNTHSSHLWSAYTDPDFPVLDLPPQTSDDDSWEISHFRRMPWVLLALELADRNKKTYYQGLKYRLAQQFDENVLYYQNEFPLLKNYLNGSNGWYNLNFDKGYGYGPSGLSYSLIQGSWGTMADIRPNIGEAYGRLLDVITSNDAAVKKLRTEYYGRILAPFNGSLLGSVDESGPGSIAEARIRILLYLYENRTSYH